MFLCYFSRYRELYYLKGLSITPSLCIAKMHTAIQKYTIQKIKSVLHIKMIKYKNTYDGGGSIRRLCCHVCWEKVSLANASNRAQK
jgi:hypothetical protein